MRTARFIGVSFTVKLLAIAALGLGLAWRASAHATDCFTSDDPGVGLGGNTLFGSKSNAEGAATYGFDLCHQSMRGGSRILADASGAAPGMSVTRHQANDPDFG